VIYFLFPAIWLAAAAGSFLRYLDRSPKSQSQTQNTTQEVENQAYRYYAKPKIYFSPTEMRRKQIETSKLNLSPSVHARSLRTTCRRWSTSNYISKWENDVKLLTFLNLTITLLIGYRMCKTVLLDWWQEEKIRSYYSINETITLAPHQSTHHL
jgi:hypothetical protein